MLDINSRELGKLLSKIRDFIIILGALVYLVGYVVWALIAWKENLGPIPALDTQYFVAGVPTVIAITFFIFVFYWLGVFLYVIFPKWLEKLFPTRPMVIRFFLSLRDISEGLVYIPFIIIAMVISYYIFIIYPSIPQSLGGAKPRCAQLDVNTINYSSETLKLLGIDKKHPSNTGDVMRSQKIKVYFYSSNFILASSLENTDTRLELDRSGVKAIRWCEKE